MHRLPSFSRERFASAELDENLIGLSLYDCHLLRREELLQDQEAECLEVCNLLRRQDGVPPLLNHYAFGGSNPSSTSLDTIRRILGRSLLMSDSDGRYDHFVFS